MAIDQYKRDLIYRRGNGKSVLNGYKEKITSLFLIDVEQLSFLSLEETDDVILKKPKERYEVSKVRVSPDDTKKILGEIMESKGEYYVFIDDDWKYCGAFLIESLMFLRDDFRFGEKVNNNIFFISRDLKSLLDLDYSEDKGKFYIEKITFELS